jgi:O-antigen ligase
MLFLLISKVNIIENQVTKVLERVQTLEYTLEGDLTAGGTVSRATSRHEPVWNKFLERPIMGWGYSTEFGNIGDPHVGNQNLLLQIGVFGYILFMALIFSLVKNMFSLGRRIKALSFTTTILIFFIMGIFMIHSTSRQMFGLGGDFTSQFSIALVFALANFVYYNRYEMIVRIKKQDDTVIYT